MALNIEYINEDTPEQRVTVGERLYRTTDGTRLVPEGHPDGAALYCAPGDEISRAEFERFELDPSLTEGSDGEEAKPKRKGRKSAKEAAEPDPPPSDEPTGEPGGEGDQPEGGTEPPADADPPTPEEPNEA